MKPEQLVASRELCQSLVDNGIVLDTYFVWGHPVDEFGKRLRKWILGYNDTNNGGGICDSCNHGWIPAPTAEDLMAFLEKLPTTNNITINPIVGNIYAVSLYTPHKNIRIEGCTVSNGLAKLAIKVKGGE